MSQALGVVFDFDGVIADSEMLHLQAFQEAFGARGWVLCRDEYYDQYLGYSDREVIERFANDRGVRLAAADMQRLLDSKERIYTEVASAGGVLCAGAEACVRRLAARFPLAIASGAKTHEIVHALEAAGLRQDFLAIVGADDVVASKPAPDPYVEAVRRIGLTPGACVAIEDSPWGLESARTAGLTTIGVTHSYPAARLTVADVVLSSLDDVSEVLIRAITPRRQFVDPEPD